MTGARRRWPAGRPCHAQMARLIDEFDGLRHEIVDGRIDPSVEGGLQRVLYGIHALLSAHLLEADDELEPLLEARLTPEERELVFERVDRYAREVRELYG